MPYDDELEEEWIDEEDDDPEAELLACPSCRRPVHEDTQQCPHCGDWIVPVYPGQQARRWVWAIAAVLVIAGLLAVTVL